MQGGDMQGEETGAQARPEQCSCPLCMPQPPPPAHTSQPFPQSRPMAYVLPHMPPPPLQKRVLLAAQLEQAKQAEDALAAAPEHLRWGAGPRQGVCRGRPQSTCGGQA